MLVAVAVPTFAPPTFPLVLTGSTTEHEDRNASDIATQANRKDFVTGAGRWKEIFFMIVIFLGLVYSGAVRHPMVKFLKPFPFSHLKSGYFIPFLSTFKKNSHMFGEKIRLIREMRGFSQENVAAKLGIAQNAYSRIELNQSKLESGMLVKVAEVLGVSPMDILSSQPAIINLQSNKGTQQSFGYVETVISGQKELYEKMLAAKDEEIARLNTLIDKLLPKK
jgi:transcriptional regulator with XRE-family HTH domain